jgi:hypothetical protein
MRHVCADAVLRPRERAVSAWTLGCIRTDAEGRLRGPWVASVQTHKGVRADASVLSLGNFRTDATMRLSHGRPSGHRPTFRPSVRPLSSA